MKNIFNAGEKNRYSRHFIIPNFGIEAQQKLKVSKVLVIGVGGLGCPLVTYLAAAGVGTIGLVDFDVVAESNLHRQILFSADDIGNLKVDAAVKQLKRINPYNEYVAYPTRLTAANAIELFKDYDVIVDGTDNFPTRYLVNDCGVFLGKPNVYGSVFQFDGQVSVFNYKTEDGKYGPNYRDLYAIPPPPDLVPSCAESGVLGVLPGIIGTFQANEVIKIITGIGKPLSGRLFVFDALSFETKTFRIEKRANNPLTGENPTIHGPVDYELFCGVKNTHTVNQISADQLYEWKISGKLFHLIDIREPAEYALSDIGGELIPMSVMPENIHRIPKGLPVVIHCASGIRSQKIILQLESEFGITNLYNLKGGMAAFCDYVTLSKAGIYP